MTLDQVPGFYFYSKNSFRPIVYMLLWCLKRFFLRRVIPHLQKLAKVKYIPKKEIEGKKFFIIAELIHWT